MKKRGLNLPKERTFTTSAGTLKRIAAFIIDMFIVYFLIGFPLNSLLQKLTPEPESLVESINQIMSFSISGWFLFVVISMEIITLLYFILLEYKTGQSIGKIIMKIKVVSEKKSLRFWQLLVRGLFLLVDILFIIDIIYYVFRRDKRRMLEVLSKTKTVETYNLG